MLRLTLKSKSPPNLGPKLLIIYKTAFTSHIPTNDTFLELSGQDDEVPTPLGLICGAKLTTQQKIGLTVTPEISTDLNISVIPF